MPGHGSLPGIFSTTITPRKITFDESLSIRGEHITIDSSVTDAGATPTHRIRTGNVVVLETGDGNYHEANDTVNGDRNTAPAAIVSAGHADTIGVIAVRGNHGLISVTTTTGTGTEAENVTDLNADASFFAHYIAAVSGTDVSITARRPGADEWFYMDATTDALAGFAEGIANEVSGADADYRVVTEAGDLLDPDATAQDAPAVNLLRGFFDESQLINLTAEAKEVLVRRGSIFA